MAILLLKKSYRHKDLKEIKFHDLWNSHGVFTTMRVIGKPARILFFKNHLNTLLKSLKVYKINKKNIKKNILKLIKLNISNKKKYDHLFRIASNNKMISISLRKRLRPKLNFNLKLVNYKRIDAEYMKGIYNDTLKLDPIRKNFDISKSIDISIDCDEDLIKFKDNFDEEF